jgi:hypothetical protein
MHLEKTMNWFGTYPTISRDSKVSLQATISLWGEKHLKVFQNRYLTEHT